MISVDRCKRVQYCVLLKVIIKHSMRSARNASTMNLTLNLNLEEFHRIISQQTNRKSPVVPDGPASQIPRTEFNQEQMKLLRERGLMRMIMKKMLAMVPLRTPPFRIFEEWEVRDPDQDKPPPEDTQTFDEHVYALHPLYRLLSFLQGLNVVFFLWALSTALVFQENVLSFGCLTIVVIQLLNATAKLRLLRCNPFLVDYLWESKWKEVVSPLCVVAGCVLMLLLGRVGTGGAVAVNLAMFGVLGVVGSTAFQYFQVAKIYAEEKKLTKEMRIVELFCVLFLLAHIFGLVLYSAVYITPSGSDCWIDKPGLSLKGSPLIVRYIYAVYWAMTTIITVGYGDITPQNYAEVLVVMVVEICGTSFFGYMISVIGGIVDKKNQKNEEYDNYQETITKLRDHYSLSAELCQKMKGDIKDKYNKQKATPLKKVEESQFLQYVDPLVKKDFIHETNIRIIKKSIFFLTYFTIHFQDQIALKLIRAIYKKDDPILTRDPESSERRLVIINHGRISLFIQKQHNNISCRKLVKTIQTVEGRPTLNVYGYSSLILDKDISLFASADLLTSAYQLRLADVLEIISRSMIDYQTFHEMRERMLIKPIKEAIEAPILGDYSYHYTPNIFILSKKENRKFYQQRSKRTRSHTHKRLELIDVVAFINFKRKITRRVDEEQLPELYKHLKGKNSKSYAQFESLLSIEEEPNSEVQTGETPPDRSSHQLNIDQIKIFDHFLRCHNISRISQKYEEACRTQSYKKRIQTNLLIKRN